MFWHIFTYRLRCLIRNKEQVFWTLLFPLLLATLFFFAFSNLMYDEITFAPIPVAVVNEGATMDNTFIQTLTLWQESQVLDVIFSDLAEATKLLGDGEVDGIITTGEQQALTVAQSGLNQSILKMLLDEYAQAEATITHILAQDPTAGNDLLVSLNVRHQYTEQISFSNASPNPGVYFFYVLIAMTCLYGSFWGLRNTIDVQADLSDKGARRNVAPTHKLQIIVYEALAALVISFGEVLLLVGYLALILGIDFGNQVAYILLTCLAGCLAGVSFGTFVGSVFRTSEGVKTAILIASSMMLSFFAGLTNPNMRDIVARNVPIMLYINPAALITDAFYCLYIFDNHQRFWLNIGLLGAVTVFFCGISFLRLRGEKYASI